MLKNVKIKKALKKSIFPVLTFINKVIPKNDKKILLYSANMGIRHNLKPLKDYLLEQGYDKKYDIVCGVESLKYAEDDDRVRYTTPMRSILEFFTAGHVYYTTGQIPIKPSKKQIVIYLDHGTTGYKTVGALSKINNGDAFYFTYATVPSPAYATVYQKQYLCGPENIAINGEPVNDIFYQPYEKYDLGDFQKVGVWAPTFRQSDYLGYDDSSEELLPMFTQEDYEALNEQLSRHNIKLMVKLHPGQSLQGYTKRHFSHLEIYSDPEFREKGYELYTLLKQSDFLVADYSSVPLQYLLVDKPIVFAIPDLEEYSQRRGFMFENVLDYMPGSKAKTKEELYTFFADVAADRDEYKEERAKVRNIIHTYQDGDNCKRALEIGKITLP